jgi:hypothetical protein
VAPELLVLVDFEAGKEMMTLLYGDADARDVFINVNYKPALSHIF